jgi:ribosomal-protein-alanine N-acetyltransferase
MPTEKGQSVEAVISINICKAQPCHVAAIGALEARSFSEPWPVDMIDRLRERFFVALAGDRLLGYAAVSTVLDEGSLDTIAVEPAFRRQGVADALVAHVLARGRARNLAFLTLEVREGNTPARTLYEKHGFQVVGRRKNYYDKPREDALLMTFSFSQEEETC